MNVNEILTEASEKLAGISDTPLLDAGILLCEAAKKDRLYLITHKNDEVESSIKEKFDAMIKKRMNHMPVAYITNKKEFMSLDYYVDERVLIPRPDTEILAEKAIELVGKNPASVLDICCGSGCIGLSVKKYCPGISLTLSDISPGAIEVTGINISRIFGNDSNIKTVLSDLFTGIQGNFDFILSNPPYISQDEMNTLSRDILDHEPHSALVADNDGLWFYEKISRDAPGYLNKGGYIIFETGYSQAQAVREILIGNGFTDTEILKDLSGLDRVVLGRKQ